MPGFNDVNIYNLDRSTIFIVDFSPYIRNDKNIKDLQSSLPKDEEQEIDEVRRNDVVEEDAEVVNELVVAYVAVGVPQRPFEGELADCGLADVQDLLPRRVAVVTCCKIVNWDLRLPVIESGFPLPSCQSYVYHIVFFYGS